MSRYSVKPATWSGWVVSRIGGGAIWHRSTQREALFLAHHFAWVDSDNELRQPVPGARVELPLPAVYSMLNCPVTHPYPHRPRDEFSIDPEPGWGPLIASACGVGQAPVSATWPSNMGPQWQELTTRATAEMPEVTWQGPEPETMVVEPWVPSEKWQSAAIPPEAVGEYTEIVVDQRARWRSDADAFHEAMRNDPNLVGIEESHGATIYTLRGAVGSVVVDGISGVAWRNPERPTADARSAAVDEVMSYPGMGFAGSDLLKSSKGGPVSAYVVDDDDLDYSGKLAERVEMHYGTRTFGF